MAPPAPVPCAPAVGSVITCEWPELSTATFTDHITARHGTGDTLLEYYSRKHGSTAAPDECADRFSRTRLHARPDTGAVMRSVAMT